MTLKQLSMEKDFFMEMNEEIKEREEKTSLKLM